MSQEILNLHEKQVYFRKLRHFVYFESIEARWFNKSYYENTGGGGAQKGVIF